MSILSGGQSDFFGLDIGVGGIRVVQLKGAAGMRSVQRWAQVQTDGNMTKSDAKTDQQRTAQAIKQLVAQAGINTNNVVANLPSNRVFTTVIDMDKMAPAELAQTIRYQADSLVPTPLNESKIDWAIIGNSPKDPKKMEVLLSSVANDFIESRLEMLESAGLNVIAFEPDNMAIVRSVVPADALLPQLVLDMGSTDTDLVVAMNGAPHLSRVIPVGASSLIRAASQNLNLQPAQAQQFVFKFGVNKDKLEGQVYNAIIGTIETLMGEIEKSIKFFAERYSGAKIDRVIVCGAAATLPNLPLYIANRFNLNVEIGNAWRNVRIPDAKQNELLSISNNFAVAVGLAEREA